MKTSTNQLDIMKTKPTINQIHRAEGTLAAATGGRRSWDSECLTEAARQCLAGGKAHHYEGHPTGAAEFAAFEAAWKRVQARK